jgi:hypothetical protein
MNRTLRPIAGSLSKDLVILDGYVHIKSDGYVDADLSDLKGMTVERVAAGVFEVTLDEAFPNVSCLMPVAVLHANVAVDLVPQVKVVSSSVFRVSTLAGATATAPSAVCGLGLLVIGRNSGLDE